MSLFLRNLKSSVGKKQVVALTSLPLLLFLVGHLGGNFLIFAGREAFDSYSAMLEENPLLVPIEIVLLTFFLLHIGFALRVNLENRRARGRAYVIRATRGRQNVANATMVASGLVVLIFVVLHVINFKFGERVSGTDPATGEAFADSLYWLVITYFQDSVLYVIWYVFAVCVLGFHVGHGLQSAFQTLGVNHPRLTPCLKWCSVGFGVLIAVGYSSLPLYAVFGVESPL